MRFKNSSNPINMEIVSACFDFNITLSDEKSLFYPNRIFKYGALPKIN